MRTRQKSRKSINVPARYFTGAGQPVDVGLRDVSEGGCRFPVAAEALAIGTPIQISIAASPPLRGTVRWIEQGEAGVTFAIPIASEAVEQFKSCHGTNAQSTPMASDFAPMASEPANPPRRFC